MKTLILLRHAKSSWKYECDDLLRPLNGRGMRQIMQAPTMFSKKLKTADLIITSPAVRAYHTATAFNQYYLQNSVIQELVVDDILFHCPIDRLLYLIKNLEESVKTVMFCCHNPCLNNVIDSLTNELNPNLSTCSAVMFEPVNCLWSDYADDPKTIQHWLSPSV